MSTERKVCCYCTREGHRSHACPLPILPGQKSENPDQIKLAGVLQKIDPCRPHR